MPCQDGLARMAYRRSRARRLENEIRDENREKIREGEEQKNLKIKAKKERIRE
jgi:hypothetical protein